MIKVSNDEQIGRIQSVCELMALLYVIDKTQTCKWISQNTLSLYCLKIVAKFTCNIFGKTYSNMVQLVTNVCKIIYPAHSKNITISTELSLQNSSIFPRLSRIFILIFVPDTK